MLATQGVDFGGFQDHSVNGGEDVLSLGYDELIAPLIKAVQEQQTQIGRLVSRDDSQHAQIKTQQVQIEAMQAEIAALRSLPR